MRFAVRQSLIDTAFALTLFLAIVLGSYLAFVQPAWRAFSARWHTDPVQTLHHDRAFMNVPAGARLWYEHGLCDSGQLDLSRRLHGSRSVRTRYEAELVRSGWVPGDEPHLFVRQMRDHRQLSVGVVGPDAHGDVTINASVEAPGTFEDC
jgi:hypothetical protein